MVDLVYVRALGDVFANAISLLSRKDTMTGHGTKKGLACVRRGQGRTALPNGMGWVAQKISPSSPSSLRVCAG